MRIFLFKCFTFFSFILLSIFIVGKLDNIDKKFSRNDNIIRLKCKWNFDSLDLLFIGNSYTYSGIDVTRIDSGSLKSLNLGIATAGPYFYDLVIADYLREVKKKPKTIFLLVSPMMFSSKADNFAAYPIHRYLNKNYSNEWVATRYNQYRDYFKLVNKSFKKGLENLLQYYHFDKELNTCTILKSNKGFVPSDSINDVNVVKRTEYLYQSLLEDTFDEVKGEYLLDLADSFKNQGIRIIFYTLPSNSLVDYFNSSFLNSYSKYLIKIKSHYSLISLDLPQNNGYFRNIDHLNSIGAKKVTIQLLLKLDEVMSISNH